jgi:hypothetical protein
MVFYFFDWIRNTEIIDIFVTIRWGVVLTMMRPEN